VEVVTAGTVAAVVVDMEVAHEEDTEEGEIIELTRSNFAFNLSIYCSVNLFSILSSVFLTWTIF